MQKDIRTWNLIQFNDITELGSALFQAICNINETVVFSIKKLELCGACELKYLHPTCTGKLGIIKKYDVFWE